MENLYAYGGLLCGTWSPPAMKTLPLQEREKLLERRQRGGTVYPADAVADAAGLEDIVEHFNCLLSSLRAAGLLKRETGQEEGGSL